MSTTTFGAAVSLELPPPKPPPYNLLTVAEQIEDGLDGVGGFSGRWRGGAAVWAYPSDLASGEDPCITGASDHKSSGEVVDGRPIFGAFTAFQPIICSTFGTRDWRELQRRANAALVAHEANAVERQLARAIFKTDNPSLQSRAAGNVLGSGAVAPLAGLALLENAIGDTAQGGVIHATPGIVASWSEFLIPSGGRLLTVGGTPVVRGTGYIGARPTGATPPDAAAGQEYAFATGPVAYARSTDLHFLPEELAGGIAISINELVYRAERDYIVAWDLELTAAVLVDWIT